MRFRYPLVEANFGREEIEEAIDSLNCKEVTMGKKVRKFERDFSDKISGGVRKSIMLNSGSSANFLAMKVFSNPLIKDRIKPGDEVIVPAVTWSTTIFPIVDANAIPHFVDVGLDYQIDVERVREAINEKTKAIFAVHLLGDACNIKELREVAEERDLFLIEDCCEALGTKVDGKYVGTFSDISTYSFYFSHHITTIEGGMLTTENEEYADLTLILRSHGMVRDSLKKEEYIKKNPNIDPRFLFINIGYNLRPTEIQGAFGIHQIRKLDSFISARRYIARKLLEKLREFEEDLVLPEEKQGVESSWFAFPVTIREGSKISRDALMKFLGERGLETRPLVCGNFAQQPAVRLFEHKKTALPISEKIMEDSFYFGIHPTMKDEDVEEIANMFEEFMREVKI